MNVVIGSGPAGVAAAVALVDRGKPVTMLDAGGELESDVRARVEFVARRRPDEWDDGDRHVLWGRVRYHTDRLPLKLPFGSDYPYRDVDRLQPVFKRGVEAHRALATGGLSVLWGAAILPFSDADFEGWPLTAADMAPDYVSSLGLTGLAGASDALSTLYPLHVTPTTTLRPSHQAQALMDHMGRHADRLAKQHVHWGRARLAVRGPEVRPCEHCGMCLHGCPYGLIYSAEQTLRERLVPSTLFTYVPGYVVRRLTERPGAVTIDAVARASLEPRRFEAARVYLAAGVLASTAIVLESLKAFARPVVLRQSDHFMLPMLLRTSAGRASTERLHTLSQLFIELLDPSISRRGVHLQVYTYNDLYARLLKDRLGPASALVAPFLEPFIDRLVVVKGYLHSDESAGIRAQLQPGASGATLSLDAVPSPQSKAIVRSVTSWLRKNSRAIGAWPLPLGRHIGLPGSGVHVGGSFPMRHQPSALECDLLGRPQGWSRVHVVDASVFPTMPAASPTLTIMANAYRIARLSQHVQEATCSG